MTIFPKMRRNKYGAQKITVDGVSYDSKAEYRRYCELKLMERCGDIRDLKRQVRFELVPAQYDKDTGKKLESPITYVADFVYRKTDTNERVIEDVKGHRTREYIMKRKLMLWLYDYRIEEVRA